MQEFFSWQCDRMLSSVRYLNAALQEAGGWYSDLRITSLSNYRVLGLLKIAAIKSMGSFQTMLPLQVYFELIN